MDRRLIKSKQTIIDTLSDLYIKYDIVCKTQPTSAQKILEEMIKKYEIKLINIIKESHTK